MFRRIVSSVLLLFLICLNGFSQKTLAGYIVQLSGDTLIGEIKKTNFADLRGSKFYGSDGLKINISTKTIKAFKVDKEIYISEKVSSLGITDKVNTSGSIFVKLIINGPVQLYSVNYCFGKKSIKDRQNRVYKERCPVIYYFKKEGDPYFEAYRYEDVSILKIKQKFESPQIANYFKDYEDLSKEILYQVIKRNRVDVMVKRYNDWKKENNGD